MLLRVVLLLLGFFACSTSVLWIKASTVHPILVAAYRLLLASLVLLIVAISRSGFRANWSLRDLSRAALPATLLAAHFISWNYGARSTSSANATLIVNMVPLAMPFLLFFLAGESVTRREIIGTLIALIGVVLLGAGDYVADREQLAGDAICFIAMVLFAGYLTYGRVNRNIAGFWLYLGLLYGIASMICFVAALPITPIRQVYPLREYLLLAGLALLPTLVGHSLINHSLRFFRGQIIAVASLSQFVFAAVLAFLFFGEKPQRNFYFASLLVATGAALSIRSAPPTGRETASSEIPH